jgi:hypothetical protein
MSVGIAVLIFLVCLIATLVSSEVLVRGLTILGTKLPRDAQRATNL